MNENEMFSLIESYMQHNNFAHNLYIAYMSLFENINKHNEILNKAPGFFDITRYALSKCMILEFAKLYCGSGEERTIYKLINIVKANLHLFNTKDIQDFCTEAERHMETKLKPIIDKLKKRRNEDLAHNDKKFFDGSKNPAIENWISCDDINELYEYTFKFLYHLIEALSIDKRVVLYEGTDDFNTFIEEFNSLIQNESNNCDENF